MARVQLVVLGVLGLLCVCLALQTEKLTQLAIEQQERPGSTHVVWQATDCSRPVWRRDYGVPLGCNPGSTGTSHMTTCNNQTGYNVYSYANSDCLGNWYQALYSQVNHCNRNRDRSSATFCGASQASSLPYNDDPLLPGIGNVRNKPTSCDYSAGGCPKNTPLQLWFEAGCDGQPKYTVVPYGGLTIGKCYLLHDSEGNPTANIQAIHRDGVVAFPEYDSGCTGTSKSAYSYLSNRCVKHNSGKYFKFVVLN